MTLSQIMKTAHRIYRDKIGYCSFSQALRMAWMVAKGQPYVFSTFFENGERIMEGGHSYDDVADKRRAATNAMLKRGIRPIGSWASSLVFYAPQAHEPEFDAFAEAWMKQAA